MNTLQNIAISASAGSGKTYTLTNRFIYLLHAFEQPERIIALTFTRTAAGEFFHKIIEKLCDAAEDPEKAASLSKELKIHADCTRYHHLLQLLIHSMHRLNLQTLDSFFFRVVSAFALELGLSGSLNLLDESSEPRMRNEVRDSIVHRPGELTTELNEFWHAFKQATYGQEARSIEKVVSDFIEQLYSLYLDTPDANRWGNPQQIWPQGCPWQTSAHPDWDQLANNLLAALPEDLGKAQINDFNSAANAIRNYGANEKLNTLLTNALAVAPDILAGSATIKVRKELPLSGALCTALADCLRAIVWHHLKRAMENTQGVHRILQAYHENYDRIVRRPGRLAFADLTHLLSPDAEGSPMGVDDEMTRQLMDFRLDGQFDHWLFDEFQDTSRPQWEVVANLIDEIVQDGSGERSFFYVGDTKQCLYLWRNSDDRLFHDIQTHYNSGGMELIAKQPLSMSWRSAPAILDAVNEAFSDNALIGEVFSTDAAARWARAWQTHEPSPATEDLSGFSCWIEAKKNDSPTRNELILKILQDLNPIERGMSVGVLVRKNADANEVADYLRENCSLPIHTGSAIKPAVDNSAGAALLALLSLAAHPGDRHAHGYLNLIDASTEGAPLANASEALRTRLLSDSNESAVRWAAKQIIEHLPAGDTRHRERLNRLIDKARAFDSEERRDIDGLIHFLRNSSSGECHAGEAVIIETIHKSKGLEYDVVILVNEDKTSRSETRISPLLDPQGKADWILEPIKKNLMQADPMLNQLLDQSTSQRGFGNLCTLYVAMTRAKRGLYMISDLDRVSKTSTVHFLKERLGHEATATELFPIQSSELDVQRSTFNYPVLWSIGDPNWHSSFEAEQPESADTSHSTLPTPHFDPAHPRLTLARPSSGHARPLAAAKCFDLDEQASTFGTAVHDAFEQIEWLAPEKPKKRTLKDDNNLTLDLFGTEKTGGTSSASSAEPESETHQSPVTTHNSPEVRSTLAAAFDNSDIRALFTKPKTASTVWRERAFSYVEGDQFTNGIFDRVVIHYDTSGAITRAEIIDFKTDRIHESNTILQATDHHRPQLEAYRKALSKIVGLNENAIELKLVFTNVSKLVSV
ncbi:MULTISPECIES: exodeoxyribonuclease V subunit beta [unclassified Lentimonas]|uniref:UvrD-helicase domain-containing protein n=1 Tax=unclassified Lentimonas TaxID=2630993 RepID=UPI001389761F|nr:MULTISPECIES: UvrD-helicase domain-containing protein [unclassified Lentimonas]